MKSYVFSIQSILNKNGFEFFQIPFKNIPVSHLFSFLVKFSHLWFADKWFLLLEWLWGKKKVCERHCNPLVKTLSLCRCATTPLDSTHLGRCPCGSSGSKRIFLSRYGWIEVPDYTGPGNLGDLFPSVPFLICWMFFFVGLGFRGNPFCFGALCLCILLFWEKLCLFLLKGLLDKI
jgi:hypothetical protein